MASVTRKHQQPAAYEIPVCLDSVRTRLEELDVPAVLTQRSGLVIARNCAWQELADVFDLTDADEDCFISELFRGRLDAGSRMRLDEACDELLTSMLFSESFELVLHRDGEPASIRVGLSQLLDQQAQVMAAVWTFQDVTAEHRIRALNRHQDKMKAISRLSAGIAHEFNNLLTAVLGNLEIMRAGGIGDPNIHLEAAESAAVRATRLVQELRHFGTRSLPGLKPQAVGGVVEKSAQILQGMCQPGVKVICRVQAAESLSARVDANLLQDVILRVGRNSLEAVADSGGVIHLEADLVQDFDDSRSVRIRVLDDGPGLEAPADEMAFEPFFTTRSPDSNSGLGLAIVYGLVEEMRGTVEIQSQPMGGTAVTMLFPFAEVAEVVEAPPVRSTPVKSLHVGLVDNEAGVRSVGQGMLKLIGHEVTTFSGGQQLLDSLAGGLKLDVILLDRAMPGMSGRETYAQVRHLGNATPVIICSGTSVELATFHPHTESPPNGFLPKPFTLAALSEAIEQAAGASSGLPEN